MQASGEVPDEQNDVEFLLPCEIEQNRLMKNTLTYNQRNQTVPPQLHTVLEVRFSGAEACSSCPAKLNTIINNGPLDYTRLYQNPYEGHYLFFESNNKKS